MGASCTASRRGVMVSVAWVEPETAEARNRNTDNAIPAIFIFPVPWLERIWRIVSQ
jgi:hypothetical protein